MERRKITNVVAKATELPVDFIKMVNEVTNAHFDQPLALLKANQTPYFFETTGKIYPDEVTVSISLIPLNSIASTTIHASIDFDPKANLPQLQDVLGQCVDAIGTLWAQFISEKDVESVLDFLMGSLSSYENQKEIPYVWTPIILDGSKIFLLLDKANPKLDQLAEDWLEKHDPDYEARKIREQQETEKLFVKGPKEPTEMDSDSESLSDDEDEDAKLKTIASKLKANAEKKTVH